MDGTLSMVVVPLNDSFYSGRTHARPYVCICCGYCLFWCDTATSSVQCTCIYSIRDKHLSGTKNKQHKMNRSDVRLPFSSLWSNKIIKTDHQSTIANLVSYANLLLCMYTNHVLTGRKLVNRPINRIESIGSSAVSVLGYECVLCVCVCQNAKFIWLIISRQSSRLDLSQP